jgi:hypothetical protein
VDWFVFLTHFRHSSLTVVDERKIGYYTSRPVLKGYTRYVDYVLRVTEQIIALAYSRIHNGLDGTDSHGNFVFTC